MYKRIQRCNNDSYDKKIKYSNFKCLCYHLIVIVFLDLFIIIYYLNFMSLKTVKEML